MQPLCRVCSDVPLRFPRIIEMSIFLLLLLTCALSKVYWQIDELDMFPTSILDTHSPAIVMSHLLSSKCSTDFYTRSCLLPAFVW